MISNILRESARNTIKQHASLIVLGLLILIGLYLCYQYNYLLFHNMIEIFSIVVACGMFMVAWNSRRFIQDTYILFLGIAFLFVGMLDLVHTLAYKGMGVFAQAGTNLSAQLWLGARYVESLSLLIAPLFIKRKIHLSMTLVGYAIVVSGLLSAVFTGIFPVCFVENAGLTTFKVSSEYLIACFLGGAIVLMVRRRAEFHPAVLRLMIFSLALRIASEMAFSLYTDAYSIFNVIGHYFKLIGFYLIYKALIETGLTAPYALLKERTAELTAANAQLQHEVVKHTQTETLLQQRNQELALLHRVSQMFSSSLELDEVLKTVLSEMRRLLNITATSFWLRVEETGGLICQQSIGPGSKTVIGWKLLPGQGIVGKAAQTGEIVRITDTRNDPQHYKGVDQETGIELRAILSIPFRVKGEVLGVLNLVDTEVNRFTDDDLRLVEPIAAAAASAVEHARLYLKAQQEINERKQAEEALRAAHADLKDTLENLQRTQNQLIESEKLAALGQLVAGIAHDIKSPVGAIRAAIESMAMTLNQTLEALPAFFQALSEDRQHEFFALLKRAQQRDMLLSTKEERQRKRALIEILRDYFPEHAGKMGELLVHIGVYNNIEPFLPLLQAPNAMQILDMADRIASLQESTRTIMSAIDLVNKVTFALKTYARYDHSEEMKAADLAEGINTVLILYQNQLKQGVEVIRNYATLPPMLCYPDELNQVWMNLIQNALYAMENKGTLEITVLPTPHPSQEGNIDPETPLLGGVGGGSGICVSITDTGKGIPKEIMSKIFDPFFTTKPPGKGSGLGLYIIRKIIEKHEGTIEVDSAPGKTTFRVIIPMKHAM